MEPLETAPPARTRARENRSSLWQSVPAAYRDELGVAGLWLVLGVGLAMLTSSVVDSGHAAWRNETRAVGFADAVVAVSRAAASFFAVEKR